jgi:hypothetical protein
MSGRVDRHPEVHMNRLLALCALAAAVSFASSALAGVPSPANSTIPACLATTPGGNILSTIIVRDFSSNPVANSLVVIDYSQCAGFAPCAQGGIGPGDGYILDPINKTIRMFSGPQGQAPFHLRAGGGCSSNGIRIYADGVLLGSVHAASADQNGDLSVDAADIAVVHAKIGTADLSGDLDCNGAVNATDEGIVTGYVGVNCLDPTDTVPRSWGSIKLIYR